MKSKSTADLPTLRTLIEAGAHFGHRRERSAPRAKKYTFSVRDGVCVINLEATQEQLGAAARLLEDKLAEGAVVLVVGTKRQAADTVRAVATRVGAPFVSERWLGGTLTNFTVIRKNVERMTEIDKRLSDEVAVAKLTKRERARLSEASAKLHKEFDGILTMTKLPDYLLIVDPREESTAVAEARRMDIPVIALCDTDVNPDQFALPIPANDDAPKTIDLILNFLGDAMERGRAKGAKN